jgi:hypothetical protein
VKKAVTIPLNTLTYPRYFGQVRSDSDDQGVYP